MVNEENRINEKKRLKIVLIIWYNLLLLLYLIESIDKQAFYYFFIIPLLNKIMTIISNINKLRFYLYKLICI